MNIYGLAGYPLEHSFSKQYFGEKFSRENISHCRYENFPLADIAQLPALLKEFPQIKGLNITIPYKENVLAYANWLSPEVQQIHACNCLTIENGFISAYNTDIIGFERSCFTGMINEHTHALVLGSGGASKAVRFVLDKMNISYLTVYRSKKGHVNAVSYDELNGSLLEKYTLLINCTPIGTAPKVENCPLIPYTQLTERHYLFDLVYNPAITLFLSRGMEKGAQVKNGYEMLVIQAEESWKIWKGESTRSS